MKKFFYVIRQANKDLWLAYKGADKWTANRRNLAVFRATSEQEAFDYVTNVVQEYHLEKLVMEKW